MSDEKSRPGLLARLFGGMDAKTISGIVALLGALGLFGVRHEAQVQTAEAMDGARSMRALLVHTTMRAESLEVSVTRLKRHVRKLEAAVYHGRIPADAYFGPPAPEPEKRHWWSLWLKKT